MVGMREPVSLSLSLYEFKLLFYSFSFLSSFLCHFLALIIPMIYKSVCLIIVCLHQLKCKPHEDKEVYMIYCSSLPEIRMEVGTIEVLNKYVLKEEGRKGRKKESMKEPQKAQTMKSFPIVCTKMD